MQTRDEYLKEAEIELGEKEFKHLRTSLDNEYYAIIEKNAKQGIQIPSKVFDNLSDGQRYHFNKHYNHRGDMVQE